MPINEVTRPHSVRFLPTHETALGENPRRRLFYVAEWPAVPLADSLDVVHYTTILYVVAHQTRGEQTAG